MIKDYMKQLETLMGSKHLLVDDWNTLGWEFFTIPLSHTRAVSLTNYTECKAEGGTITFTLEHQDYPGDDKPPVVRVLSSEGSGPHGIPWWDAIVADELLVEDVADLARRLMEACKEEGDSHYWDPWRDGHPHRTLLFQDRSIRETEDRLVEIQHAWDEAEFEDSVRRAKEADERERD